MNLSLTRNQIFVILAAAAAAIVLCIVAVMTGQGLINLSAFGTANVAAPADTSSPSPSTSASSSSAACTSQVHYYAADDGKESTYAFGPDVSARSRTSVLSAINTRLCKDPALVSAIKAHLARDYDTLDADEASYADSRASWKSAVASIMKKLRAADFTTTPVYAGARSLYMVENSDGTYDIRKGKTSTDGTAAVFVIGGVEYKFRLDCGIQPVQKSNFPASVKEVPGPTPTPSSHPTPTPSKTLEKKNPKQDPYPKGHATQGGGKNTNPGTDTYVTPTKAPTPAPTHRTNPSPPSSGSGSSSAPVPSATPAPVRTVPPPEQGAPDPSTAPSTCSAPPGGSC